MDEPTLAEMREAVKRASDDVAWKIHLSAKASGRIDGDPNGVFERRLAALLAVLRLLDDAPQDPTP